MTALAEVRDRVLDAAKLAAGDDVLDLVAGAGLLTFGALDRIGDGWVLAVDPSVEALEELLRGAHERKAPGVMYLVGDPSVIPLPDASVDACVTRSVLGSVDDLGRAAGEIHRVLRRGGRLSACEPVSGGGADLATAIDWSPLGADLASRVARESDDNAAANLSGSLDGDSFRTALEEAGFAGVTVKVESLEDEWLVDARTADARLDAITGAGERSLRQRWQDAFAADEVAALVAHVHAQAGQTLVSHRPQAWIRATRP
jgi:ubiquinone/menaquinone biosynthesis C-methylase UbiE